MPENRVVRLKADQRSVALIGGFVAPVFEVTPVKLGPDGAPIAVGLHPEIARQRVDGFGTDAVQPDRLLKCSGIVFAPCIDLGYYLHDLTEGNTPAVVAHFNAVVGHPNVDGLAVAHNVLIDAVVDGFFEQNVYAIVGGRAVAEFTDVHARPEPDVFAPVERTDAVFVVLSELVCGFCHGSLLSIRDKTG